MELTKAAQADLEQLARRGKKAEADRARAILLTAQGWPSTAIGEALRVRADNVRRWRHRFRKGGVEGLHNGPNPGRPALEIVEDMLSGEQALGAPPPTLPRLSAEFQRRTGQRISISYLSQLMRKKGGTLFAAPGTPSGGSRTPRPSPPQRKD